MGLGPDFFVCNHPRWKPPARTYISCARTAQPPMPNLKFRPLQKKGNERAALISLPIVGLARFQGRKCVCCDRQQRRFGRSGGVRKGHAGRSTALRAGMTVVSTWLGFAIGNVGPAARYSSEGGGLLIRGGLLSRLLIFSSPRDAAAAGVCAFR
jgi:hypothetical protein